MRQRIFQNGRGIMIVSLGVVGMFAMLPFAGVAWAMARNDLRKLRRGIALPYQARLAKAGVVLGAVGCVSSALGIGAFVAAGTLLAGGVCFIGIAVGLG